MRTLSVPRGQGVRRAVGAPLASAGIRAGRLPGRSLPAPEGSGIAGGLGACGGTAARGRRTVAGTAQAGRLSASCFPFNCARRRAGASTERGAYDSTASGPREPPRGRRSRPAARRAAMPGAAPAPDAP
ncbi:hypothetical protein BLAT2472_10875 [Burkholderia latens]